MLLNISLFERHQLKKEKQRTSLFFLIYESYFLASCCIHPQTSLVPSVCWPHIYPRYEAAPLIYTYNEHL